MKRLILVIIFIFALNPTGFAANVIPAEEILKENINIVIDVLDSESIPVDAKKERIDTILSPLFDFPTMAKLSMGKSGWRGLNPSDRDTFTTLYTRHLKSSYLDNVIYYTNETVVYDPPIRHNPKKVQISTILMSNNKKITLTYKMYLSKECWKIYDVEVQGVSLVRSYQSQISEILKSGTINDVFDMLNTPKQN
ncbi:MAG: ABC transporter substrate-binding protein [Deltaproteobacteria bacterium]|nr:ABC transporter substrate-binding protein [Deltaproteobacteria bacterium]